MLYSKYSWAVVVEGGMKRGEKKDNYGMGDRGSFVHVGSDPASCFLLLLPPSNQDKSRLGPGARPGLVRMFLRSLQHEHTSK